MMLHSKYQGSRPCDFRLEDFFKCSYLAYVNHVTPGARTFLAPGYSLNNFGRGPLGDATYQISRLYAF